MAIQRILISSSRLARTSAVRSMSTTPARAATRDAVRTQKDDKTSVESNPGPLKKSHDDAKGYHAEKDKDLSEGHSVARQDRAEPFKDVHTQEVSKATKQREGKRDSGSEIDTVNLAHGKSTGQGEEQRQANATTEGKKAFQPGQKGDQVGSGASGGEGKQPGEGMTGTKDAPKNTTWSALGEQAKNFVGKGPASGFHTYARSRFPSSVPESAVDKGARKPKDTKVGGAQSEHLPHHAPGEGDKMPAVKNSASLPSKKGDASHQTKRSMSSKSAGQTATDYNQPGGRATGTATTPGSRAVDPESKIHSPSFAPNSGAQATYTHVVGSPDPDSHKTKYNYSTQTSSGGIPSGTAPRSSTSSSPYNEATTAGILKNEAGIGSSNDKISDTLKGADEMVEKQALGGAGDDVGGRGEARGHQAYRPPPDLGQPIEDTLPKPIKP